MFSRKSFSAGRAFSETSWRFDGATPAPESPTSGGGAKAKRARQQREIAARNTEIIMAIVAIVTSGALDE